MENIFIISLVLWAGWIALFLFYETFALLTKDKYWHSLSRTIWKSEQLWPIVRWVIAFGIIWLFFHLVLGECALGIC